MPDSSHEFSGPTQPLDREGPEVMQAFVGRHSSFFVLLAVLLAQLLLLSFQITRNHKVRLIQLWAVTVFTPFERSAHWAVSSTTETWRKYSGLLRAQEDNRELRLKLDAAETRIQQLSEQAAAAENLRAILELKKSLPYVTVAAEVIARSPGERANAVYIDKGEDAGLTTDLPVMTPQGIVGKIIAVFPHTSQVLLLTDTSSGVGCMLEKTRVQGVLKGNAPDLPHLNYIMDEHPVGIGERVLTSGLDQIYPAGLPVGVVVEAREGHVYKAVSVQPTAPLDRLETVLVVMKPFPPEPASAPPHP